jgi:hypothetical protein
MGKVYIVLFILLAMPLFLQEDVQKKLKELKEQLEQLKSEYESKIKDLEKKIDELKANLLEKEIEYEVLTKEFESEKKESKMFRQQISRVSYLPDISVIADIRYMMGKNILDDKFSMSEIELGFSGTVDPYFAYSAFLSLEREPSGEFALHPEEAYAKFIGLRDLGLRVGKFRVPITKSNIWHTHQRLYGVAPIYYKEYFTEEGFLTEGLHIYYQISQPQIEFSGYILNNRNSAIFSVDSSHLLPLLSVKNFFPFSPQADLEVITSLSYGPNQFGKNTFLLANTAFYRWKNTDYPYNKVFILTENIFAKVGDATGVLEEKNKYANYTLFSYHFSKYIGVGLDFSVAKELQGARYITGYGIIFDVFPSEFSLLRLNYHIRPDNNERIFFLELNLGIGKHSAHTY